MIIDKVNKQMLVQKVSNSQLASESDIDRSNLHNWRNKKAKLSLSTVKRILKVLKMKEELKKIEDAEKVLEGLI